jgi:hypothetical protein
MNHIYTPQHHIAHGEVANDYRNSKCIFAIATIKFPQQ